jgi:hypothetical protein
MSTDTRSPNRLRFAAWRCHASPCVVPLLADLRYADYSVSAKMISSGVAVQEGDLGTWNLASTRFSASRSS